jgi:acyl carrier protein
MAEQSLEALVRKVLRGVAPDLEVDVLDPDLDLREEADLDSMDFLNLVTGLHEATGIEIPERDYPRVATIAGCAAYLAARQNG